MKKFVTLTILFVMVAMLATTVNAMGSADLANKLYAIGSKKGMTAADKVKVERYFSQYPASDAEAEKIIAKANEAVAVMDAENVSNVNALSAEGKDKVMSIANSAAGVVGAKLDFGAKTVTVSKDGKDVVTFSQENNGNLPYTGNSVNAILVVSSVAAIALVAGTIVRKKIVNA